jgi:ribosomal protein L16 Arg81 hydroxylase
VDNAGLIKDSDQKYDVIKFRDYIEQMKQGSKKYLKFSRIVDENSDMKKDFDYKWLRRFRTKFSQNDLYYFFMGGKNTITPIHDGYAITVFVQIKGVKRWIFYPCNQRLFIGARPKRFNYFYSESDPYQLDNPKFPLMKHAQRKEILLNEGDVLYFPSLIWHQVENVTDSIGVAYKFADVLSGFKSSKMLATCFFLATKPFLIETLLPWRGDTYNYKKK